jgi:hypothetical protein
MRDTEERLEHFQRVCYGIFLRDIPRGSQSAASAPEAKQADYFCVLQRMAKIVVYDQKDYSQFP